VIPELDTRFETSIINAQNLLVDRHCFGIEAALGELLRHLRVRFDGLVLVTLLEVKVSDLEADVRIPRVRG
jgi:hypothetical protein